jgi:UDP-2,3-diacylglucosamine pyrophosphatase LpxH
VRRNFGLELLVAVRLLKQKVKNALEYICRFEDAVAREVRARGFDGVVCGHIHHAAIKTIGGILYLNDGDWVESCTALVEDAQGTSGDSLLGKFAAKERHPPPPSWQRTTSRPPVPA